MIHFRVMLVLQWYVNLNVYKNPKHGPNDNVNPKILIGLATEVVYNPKEHKILGPKQWSGFISIRKNMNWIRDTMNSFEPKASIKSNESKVEKSRTSNSKDNVLLCYKLFVFCKIIILNMS